MIYDCFGTQYNVFVVANGIGANTTYQLMSNEVGPIATINIPYLGKSDTVIAIKDYSENEGMLQFLEDNGIIKQIFGSVPSGFVNVPIVEIDKERLLSA